MDKTPSPQPYAEGTHGFVLNPSDVDAMPPLLHSLSVLCRLRGKALSPRFLLSRLSGGNVSAQACLRIVRAAGLSGGILHRPHLEEISPLTLPCILLLSSGASCVLTRMTPDRKGEDAAQAGTIDSDAAGEPDTRRREASEDENWAECIFPEMVNSTQKVPLSKLREAYSGYTLYVSVPDGPQDAPDAPDTPELGENAHWFWSVMRYYAPIYRHVALASLVINCIALASPLFVMNVYDRVVPNNAFETLWVLALGVLIIHAFDFLLRSLRTHFVDVAGRNADVVLSSMLVDRVLTMRLASKPESTGSLVNNVREFEHLREFFGSTSLLACIDVPFVIIFLALIAFLGGPLVLVPLTSVPLLIGLGVFLQALSRRNSEQGYRQNMQKNALLVDMVNGLETIKACQAESRMQRLWESLAGLSALSAAQARRYSGMAVTVSLLVSHVCTVILIVWGVYRIADGSMSMGALIGCNILAGRAMAPILQVASLLTRLQHSRISLRVLDMLMSLPSENERGGKSLDFGMLEPAFTLDGVSFSYPQAERLAVEEVSLHINPGERVGIIGSMGSGKSTLARLMLGLYEPQRGSVCFGGVDIRQLPLAELRGRIGVLPQDVTLFPGSIRENIVLGDLSIPDDMVMRAARLAGVTDFVRLLPGGFETSVGEQGKALSGGQRQAVALARALVRDPAVLLLDEPTSNMDGEAEQRLQRHLTEALEGRTLILVTHRASLLQMVDKLAVLDNGKLSLFGPREEVLQRLNGPRVIATGRVGEIGGQQSGNHKPLVVTGRIGDMQGKPHA